MDVPDEIGESLGWQPIDVENHPQAASAKPQVREAGDTGDRPRRRVMGRLDEDPRTRSARAPDPRQGRELQVAPAHAAERIAQRRHRGTALQGETDENFPRRGKQPPGAVPMVRPESHPWNRPVAGTGIDGIAAPGAPPPSTFTRRRGRSRTWRTSSASLAPPSDRQRAGPHRRCASNRAASAPFAVSYEYRTWLALRRSPRSGRAAVDGARLRRVRARADRQEHANRRLRRRAGAQRRARASAKRATCGRAASGCFASTAPGAATRPSAATSRGSSTTRARRTASSRWSTRRSGSAPRGTSVPARS